MKTSGLTDPMKPHIEPQHRCMNCDGYIHGMLCSIRVNTSEATVDISSLLVHLSSFFLNKHEADVPGHLCLFCYKNALIRSKQFGKENIAPSLPVPLHPPAPGTNPSDSVDEAPPSIEHCTWSDIEVSAGKTNPIRKIAAKRALEDKDATHLKGFMVNGQLLPIAVISKDDLKKWCIRTGKSEARSLSKQSLCEKLHQWKREHDIRVARYVQHCCF
jgi:hypothetical protein